MQDHQTQSSSDEIDLGVVFEKIRSFFKSILIGIVQIFQFFWMHKFRILIILVIGIGLQLLYSLKFKKIYENEFLIRTNYESSEYLHGKVKTINAKLRSNDSVFLKQVFGNDYSRVEEIEIKPVIGVYDFVNESEENHEIFKLLLDQVDDMSFLENEININEYANHRIKLYVEGEENNSSISNSLYNYISDNLYFTRLKDIALRDIAEQLEENYSMRAQIDSVIKDYREKGIVQDFTNTGISFNASQDVSDLLELKQKLSIRALVLKNQMHKEDETLKVIDSSYSVLSDQRNPSKLLIPIILVGFYCLFFLIKYIRISTLAYLKENR